MSSHQLDTTVVVAGVVVTVIIYTLQMKKGCPFCNFP
jgi:hypothetical protein